MSLLSFLRRIGFAAAALAALALSAAGVVAPRVAAAAPAPVVHAAPAHQHHAHAHADADAGHMESGAASHSDHASRGKCGDACCGPASCALPVPPIAARLTVVSEINVNWLPAETLMDLGLAYSIERPPRG